MATPTYQTTGTYGQTAGGSPAATLSVGVPAGVTPDDVIVITGTMDTIAATPSSTNFALPTDSPIAGSNLKNFVLWKRATGADSGSYTVNFSTNSFAEGAAIRISGCKTSGDPWEVDTDAAFNNTNATVTPAVAITTTGPDRLLIHSASNWAGGTWTASAVPSPGFTTRASGGFGVHHVATMLLAAAGATGSVQATCTSSDKELAWLGALFGEDTVSVGYVAVPFGWPVSGPFPGILLMQDPRATEDSGPAPSAVTIDPAVATWSAVAVQADPQPVQLTLTPATSSWSAVAVTPTPGQTAVTISPAVAAWSAVVVGAQAQVSLTPATAAWSAVVVVTTPSTTISPATAAWSAVAVTPTPGQVALTLTPATAAWSARPLSLLAQVALTPATATWTAVTVSPVPGATAVTLTPATAVWSAAQVALTTPGAMTVLPATATWSAVAVTPTPGQMAVTITPATAAWSARPVVPTPAVTLTPATAAFSARPLALAIGQVARTLTPAVASWSAVALIIQTAGEPGRIGGRSSRVGTTRGVTVAASIASDDSAARIVDDGTSRAGRVDGNVL